MAKQISTAVAERFEVARDQLQSFYDEFVKLSNKKPDSAVNKFKLLHLNRVVKAANELLGSEYVPFAEFTDFNEDEVPSNSDVVMMLAQYLSQMDRFHIEHSVKESQFSSKRTWLTDEHSENRLHIEGAAEEMFNDGEKWDDDSEDDGP